jgi:hopene-associated glycosyltransferase HpnB
MPHCSIDEGMIAAWIGGLSCSIWIYLIAARGRFWRVSITETGLPLQPESAPRIAVIVPARNEEDVVRQAILSLLGQDYAGPLRIFVVDDHSSDDTATMICNSALQHGERLAMISSAPLPEGWTGKMWALSQGVQKAEEFAPNYFLFTDADIVHAPSSVNSLVRLAQAGDLDLVSMMVKLRCSSLAERALIPAFVFFFFMLYPPEWVNSPKQRTAAAAGGDILVRAEALARMGGIAAIRNELIDDCALAREIKRGGSIWLGLTQNACSIRTYAGFAGIGRMISRNAFYQLRHSICLLLATLLALTITYLAPSIVFFFGGWAMLSGAVAWLLMSIAFWPILRFYSLSPLWAPLLPFIALFYMAATLHSAVQYWIGRGGKWKGRVQDTSHRIRVK